MQTHKRKTETKVTLIQTQAKGCQAFLAIPNSWQGESMALLTLLVLLLASSTQGEYILLFNYSVCGRILQQPLETNRPFLSLSSSTSLFQTRMRKEHCSQREKCENHLNSGNHTLLNFTLCGGKQQLMRLESSMSSINTCLLVV